ncbi:hypothetical protein F4779DRAFT_581446 [Xylariaceae sp. FL0662B]|nr:hypothetical protein F4779DRAFT_581446 [Xylariaceae sp. FL0662B]
MSIEVHRPETINSTLVGFVQEPDGRGTLSLLFSCLLTLSLCVWSAVHLNLPKYDESESKYAYRYFKWSILGLFGPELVIWAAWRQYISARALTRLINEDDHLDNSTVTKKPWTMVHSFYAGMGGFVFDLTTPDITRGPRFVPNQRRLHLTARGVQLLAQCGLLPDTAESEIRDKSKTDGSGKVICSLQVGWILVQAITRAALGLAVTPLETNTIGHVLCALINYILWWHKPRWIQEPTVLQGEWTRAMCAFMYMSSQVSAKIRNDRDLLRDFGVRTEMSEILYVPSVSKQERKLDGPFSTTENLEISKSSEAQKPDEVTWGTPLTSGVIGDESPKGGSIILRSDFNEPPDLDQSSRPADEVANGVAEQEMQLERWKLACEAIERFPAIRRRLEFPESDQDELRYREALRLYPEMPQKVRNKFGRHSEPNKPTKTDKPNGLVCVSEELVVDRSRNWPGDDLVRHMQGHLMGIILWSASTVYGAVHLAGWNEQFPTNVESWFWRMSAAYIVFSGLLWSLLNLLGHLSGSVWWFWYDILASTTRRRSHIILYVLCCIGGTLYVVARVYLVAEAFVSLRALPASAYASPSWILTVPHL